MNLPAINSVLPVFSEWEETLRKYNLVESPKENLLPLSVLDSISSEVANAKTPASREAVTKWAKFLVGAYPARQMQDPDVYIRSVVFDMSEYPEEAIGRAVHSVRRNSKFIPSCAEIREACEFEMKSYEFIEQMVRIQRLGHEKADVKPVESAKSGKSVPYTLVRELAGQLRAPLAKEYHMWKHRMDMYAKSREWPEEWGPAPGEPGCKVPEEHFKSLKEAS